MSYYHGAVIYNGQTPICMSEPRVYEIWREQIQGVHRRLAPKKYLLSMDEVRAGGSYEACGARGMTMGEIFADAVTRPFKMIREVNPEAEVLVWSDMLDPHHNANPERKYYYLTAGSFVDSWKQVPKELAIVCRNHRIRRESLQHFSSLGFRTLAGAYYEADDLRNVRNWLEALDETPGAIGILYTTWLDSMSCWMSLGSWFRKENKPPRHDGHDGKSL